MIRAGQRTQKVYRNVARAGGTRVLRAPIAPGFHSYRKGQVLKGPMSLGSHLRSRSPAISLVATRSQECGAKHSRSRERRRLLPRTPARTSISSSAGPGVNGHTSPNAPTSGYRRGIGFQSTGAGRKGRLLPCRTCSIYTRTCNTICLPCAVTSRTVDSGCAGRRDRGSALRRVRDQAQLRECQSLNSCSHSQESLLSS